MMALAAMAWRWLIGGGWKVTLIIGLTLALWSARERADTLKFKLLAMTEARNLEAANHRATKVNFRNAMSTAKLEHEAVKLAIESNWKDVVHETETDARAELDRALVLAAAHAGRVRQQASARAGAGSATGQADPARAAPAAAVAGGAGGVPQLDDRDLQICTANTVKARGWQPFYEGLGAARGHIADAGKMVGEK